MDVQYYGANCVTLTVKNTRIVIDDNLADLGGKSVTKNGDIALFTGAHGLPAAGVKLSFDSPGEYEVSDISITGIPARAHLDEGGLAATMYKIATGEVTILVTGHIYPELSDKQLEAIGLVDLMIVPVGGSGYTLDPVGALKVIKSVEPKVVVPTHYDEKGITYPVPQVDLKNALHDLAMEPQETTAKLRLKPSELSDVTHLVVLEKS
ncbi:MAG TPA: MBL fold metallo-hydrolase [Candidatus Saccharimonadales bacterium]